jgi:hypothetical protein
MALRTISTSLEEVHEILEGAPDGLRS